MSPWRRAVATVARAPFTSALDLAILLIALGNGSATGGLAPPIGQAWGFDPLRFWQGHWHSLVTGTLLVRNLAMLAGLLAFLILAVGGYEKRLGSARAIVLFLLAHVATLLLTAALLVFPLHLAGAPLQSDWAPAGDVGASFGGFGCLGGWVRRQDWPARRGWIGVVTLLLAAKLLIYPERFGDVGHIIAFYDGMLLDRLLFRSR